MEIIINGKQAYMKKNASFDFIFENRLFTGSDSYTLTITFPLSGCAQNIDIFGHIHRADVVKSKVVFDCDIRDGAFFRSGSITITEISDVEVKTQFLEGRSEQNFDESFDDIFLNEMDLGYPSQRKASNVPVMAALKPYPVNNFVPLPWVNNFSGNIQNGITTVLHGYTGWEKPSATLTFQPYLIYILKRICTQLDYTYDFKDLEESIYQYLLICNTLPASWNAWNFAIALPHWSLTEFFEQLENFLFGEFDINHKAKSIVFHFSKKMAEAAGEVALEQVVDSYTAEVTQDDDSKYMASSNIKYADNDALLWPYYSCDWFVRYNKSRALVFNTMQQLLAMAATLKESGVVESGRSGTSKSTFYHRGYTVGSDGNRLFYCRENDTYFVMYCYKSVLVDSHNGRNFYRYYNRLQPVNQFGELYAGEDADNIELKIVPAWIEDTGDNHGNILYLDCGEMGDSSSWRKTESGGTSSWGGEQSTYRGHDDVDYDAGALAQGAASYAISMGEKKKSEDYFSVIYVGFWDGTTLLAPYQPHPLIDTIDIRSDFTMFTTGVFSLRLKKTIANSLRSVMYKIDGKKKFHFSFLSDTIPNPRALFYIRGQRYICEKVTATFLESGKSQLLKGVFYRVLDD